LKVKKAFGIAGDTRQCSRQRDLSVCTRTHTLTSGAGNGEEGHQADKLKTNEINNLFIVPGYFFVN
jgi:hypothetical protein